MDHLFQEEDPLQFHALSTTFILPRCQTQRSWIVFITTIWEHFSWGQMTLLISWILGQTCLCNGTRPKKEEGRFRASRRNINHSLRQKNSFLIHFLYQPYSFQGATCCFFPHGLGSFKPFASIQVSHDMLLQDSSSAPSITFKSKTRLMVVAAMVRWTLGLGILRTFNLKSNLTWLYNHIPEWSVLERTNEQPIVRVIYND